MSHRQHIHTTHPGLTDTSIIENVDSQIEQLTLYGSRPLPLIYELCHLLKVEGITYCHWKSNNALNRSANAENDLDLLVSRAEIPRFSEILYRLKFKRVKAPVRKQMPGVLDYYGYDEQAGKMVHVHAHYKLILGHDMTKNYHLSIERMYLDSAVQGELFKVPSVEFEFIVFVIRMVLKHSTWDAILSREGKLKAAEKQEFEYLHSRINIELVKDILTQHLPYIDIMLFNNCIRTLGADCPIWIRLKTAKRLQASLRANVRIPVTTDTILKLWRRLKVAIRRRVLRSLPKYRLESGGAMIAIVGGDGAGKTTAVDALFPWLSENFETTRVHLGKPSWSWMTITIRSILKIGNLVGLYPADSSFRETLNQKSPISPGYPWLLREVCKARDRYRTYLKARRVAIKGGLVICDRFPLPQIRLMDGRLTEQFINQLINGPQAGLYMSPRPSSLLARFLAKQERSYYHQIAFPDLLIVLRIDPEIAVKRKTNEDSTSVRERSTEIWELNWDRTNAHIIDASKSATDVLTELKALIWKEL